MGPSDLIRMIPITEDSWLTLSLSMITSATGPNCWKYSAMSVWEMWGLMPATNTLCSSWFFLVARTVLSVLCLRPWICCSKLGTAGIYKAKYQVTTWGNNSLKTTVDWCNSFVTIQNIALHILYFIKYDHSYDPSWKDRGPPKHKLKKLVWQS